MLPATTTPCGPRDENAKSVRLTCWTWKLSAIKSPGSARSPARAGTRQADRRRWRGSRDDGRDGGGGHLFFRQPIGFILGWPAQAGYGDKWPSQ